MITASTRRTQPEALQADPGTPGRTAWMREWRESVTEPGELLRLLGLPADAVPLRAGGATFPLRVPRAYVARMRKGDASDPLLRQVLPLADEDAVVPGFGTDAVGDLAAAAGAGVLHKYDGRALLVATGSCAVHCRYCFRRHFPYDEETAARNQWRDAIAWLRDRPDVSELILSGGDPWSLATHKLAELTDAVRDIAHVRRLRVHTRLPVVLPNRVDEELLAWVRALPVPLVVVIHANHAAELDDAVAVALSRLRDAGATLLNQSVLLRGVNDGAQALAALSERLMDCGVLPYYLHLLDRVAGTAHFEVDEARALALVQELRERLPGYLVPRLVRETAGAPSKLPVGA
ncbi:MAG TPA: EF-P beta-lysylation protein EpmB [Xanthomonadales bacterium]|nr:EF-P beta-lysylation protein EpmB [Xanthomonadales bacterium]